MTFPMMFDRISGKMDARRLCQIARENNLHILDLMDKELQLYGEKNLQLAMSENGIKCGCLITAVSFYSAPQKAEEQTLAALEKAKRMKAQFLMIIPGQPMPAEEKACAKNSIERNRDIAVQYYKKAVKMAAEYGITVCLEDTPQYYKPLCSLEDCKYILERVDGLGLIFDTGNVKIVDTKADELEFYEAMKARIVRIHLKDVVIGDFKKGERCQNGDKLNAVMTGSGIIRIKELLKRLKDDDYQGDLVIEYAACPGVSGKKHADVIKSYCSYIRKAWNDEIVPPPYREIPGVGKPVSRIFFGTAIMPMLRGKNMNALLDSIYALGINSIDCARGYGAAEKSLGMWIRERNNRDRIVLLTKCGNISLSGKVCVNREVIEKELELSLKTLGTDYIDIYLLHRDDPNTSVSEIIDCLNEAKRKGKIRVFGVSNWTHERIIEANEYAEKHGLEGFSVSSPNFGLAEQVADPWGGGCVTISGPKNEKAREWYAESKMPVMAYSSLGRGFFSGRFKSGDMEGAKKVLDGPARKGYLCATNMERLRRAEILAGQKNCNVPQIAMRYIFGNKMNVFAIVSVTNPERMCQNIEAALNPLSEDEVLWLENVKE